MMENGNRNIILIGYRGTGKTSVGQELARRLKRPFLDTDALIEEREGRTIRAMVDKEGWAFFREREKAAMNSLKAIRSCIIATGGGAVLDPDNARLLKSLGLVVLLTATEEVTIQRMLADPTSRERRPSLLGKDSPDSSNEALLKETREILKQRMPIYRTLADVILDTSQESPAEIADQILRHFCSNQAQSNVGTSV